MYEYGVLPVGSRHHGGLSFGGCSESKFLEHAFKEMPDAAKARGAADYNNKSDLPSVEKMFCKAIELAVEDELHAEEGQ
jgi:hypothetical protein